MLEALRKLDEERKKAQQQLAGSLERVQELEQQNQWLAAAHIHEQNKAEAAAVGQSKANGLVRDMQERERLAETQTSALHNTVERQKAELQARDTHVRGMEAQQDEIERKMQDLVDEVLHWKHAAAESEFELQETQRKMVHQHERYQDLTVRYERMEVTMQTTRSASEESKFSRTKEIDAKDDLHKKETQLLCTQLRAAEHALLESRDNLEAIISERSEKLRKEELLRREVEVREETSKVQVGGALAQVGMCLRSILLF